MDSLNAVWRVRLLNGPTVESGAGETVTRFRSKKVGALLAYLALRVGKRCPREEISDALWPEEPDEQALSNRLRFTLASLRKQLEPGGAPFGSVLDVSTPGCIRLRAEAVWCDVIEFDKALSEGRRSDAAKLLAGPLMPGCYDEWIRSEQIRFDLLREEFADELPAAASPQEAQPVGSPNQRLPLYLTRFFGRSSELVEVPKLVEENRLVTLSGPPGIGKTRLAVEAARLSDRSVTFVALAELTDPSRVGDLVMDAFGISSRTDASAVDPLSSFLSERPPTLVVLDNVDHLVQPVSEFVTALLAATPSLHILVTSRQRLEIPGESSFVVAPLASTGVENPAIALFVDRAKGVRPDFVLQPKVLDAVTSICQKLDGVPLALELAAVRVTAQSPSQIAEALSASLIDLKSRQRGLAERHRSLRAAVQGSYDLLPPELQSFFCQLAVFEGGWTADAARVVTQTQQAEAYLEELVVRSLVSMSDERYAFLETLRQFAYENLPADKEDLLHRHASYYLTLAAAVNEDDIRTYSRLDRDQENLIKAILRPHGEFGDLFWDGLAGALEFAFVRGHHRQALRWIDDHSNRFETIADAGISIRLRNAACQILPDVERLDEAREMALAMARAAVESGNQVGMVYADVVLGYVAEFTGNLEEADYLHRKALDLAREVGDRRVLQTALAHLSGTLSDLAFAIDPADPRRTEILEEAADFARELITLAPEFSRRRPLGPVLLGTALNFDGKFEEAMDAYVESRRTAIELGTTTEWMYASGMSSEILYRLGDLGQAALLLGEFFGLQERMGYSLARAQFIRPAWATKLEASLRHDLGDAQVNELLLAGRTSEPGFDYMKR